MKQYLVLLSFIGVFSCTQKPIVHIPFEHIKDGDLLRVSINSDSIIFTKEQVTTRVWLNMYGQAVFIDFSKICMTYEKDRIINCFETLEQMSKEIERDFNFGKWY